MGGLAQLTVKHIRVHILTSSDSKLFFYEKIFINILRHSFETTVCMYSFLMSAGKVCFGFWPAQDVLIWAGQLRAVLLRLFFVGLHSTVPQFLQ